MSFNHSRSDKSDAQYRKSGRSAGSHQQRTSSGAYGKGGGGGPALSPSSSSTSSNRRVNIQAVTSSDIADSSAHRHVQNGAHSQPPLHGVSDAPVSTGTSKPIETPSTQRNTRTVPKAPTSQSASLSAETASPVTPTKRPGDASKAFPFQFGSISPGFMNGMQIPARTSSAPPNLDEQKCDQSRNDTFQPAPPVPIPAPKQQLPRKDMGAVDQSNAGDAYPVRKARKDVQVSAALPVSQTQKPSVLPIPMTSMQMPFHQSAVSLQFGGPNSQIQTQGVPPTSLQVPMPMTALPMGSAPQLQQPMFVPGLQPHPMQPQGIMHQGQGLAFAPQMGPQLGNLRIGISSQYPQQQGGKFGGQRKTTVKITDPKTHEELRLDKRMDMYTDSGSSGLRSHPNMPPQSQPIPSYAPTHPINYYSNSYNPNNLFFQPSSALSLTGGQIAPNSQPPRFNYSVSQGLQNASIVNPSTANSLPKKSGISTHAMAEPSSVEQMRDAHNMISSASSGTVQVKVKSANSTGEKLVDSLSSNSLSAVDKELTSKLSGLSVEGNSSPVQKDTENVDDSSLHHSQPGTDSSASKLVAVVSGQPVPVVVNKASNSVSLPPPFHSEESVLVGGCAEGGTKESLSRSNSVKDHQKKLGKKGYIQSHQIGGQSTSVSSALSCTKEQSISSNSGSSDSADTKTTLTSSSVISEAFIDSVPAIGNSAPDVSKAKVNNDDTSCVRAETASPRGVIDSLQSKDDGIKREDKSSTISSESISSGSVHQIDQREKESSLIDEVRTLERVDEPAASNTDNDRVPNNTDAYMSRELKSTDIEKSHVDDDLVLDELSTKVNSVDSAEVPATKSSPSDQQFSPVSNPDHSESRLKLEGENMDNSRGGLGSIALSSSKDRVPELTRTKSTTSSFKKKMKEILQKADAAGTTSDLYMAYKGPEEKKENASSSEVIESASASSKQAMTDPCPVDSVVSEIGLENKVEPEDWEDAADISTPKPETSDNREQVEDTAKKYSRDFLLKFSEQCTELPQSFEITSDIADALMTLNISQIVERESFPSPGRVMDRSNSGSRMDRRGSGIANDDRWSKLPGPFGIARDLLVDVGFGVNVGFRPGQGGNYGVLRNPRTQAPIQYAGGILSGPMQAMGSQGGMQRNNLDAERWQRATNFQQKGLIPSPQTPLQIMHKAERKYEVGKITDEEEAKQRQLKAILNKLTPQNFEKLFEQVKAVNIDNAVTLTGVISQIFDKALMEPTFCEMYANFCYHLAGELPDFTEDNERITFKRLLLNKCQEEFERGEREQEEANKVEEEGEVTQSAEAREEKRTNARRRMLGNIRLIGELYKKKMLTERIMHECIKKLLGQYQNPDEEDVEALCKLMSTIGEMIDHPKAKEHMDAYFDWMAKLSKNMKLSSRVRFMLKDAIDLRKNKWQQRRKVEGPKKIDEVHRDAAQERHHQTGRLSRNPSINPSLRRAPMDLGPRGSSMIFSPNAQMGGFHGLPAQIRGFGNQDVRFDERQLYDARNLSVPLSRPLGEDSITLGPQGGLARGSISGPTAMTSNSLADIPPSPGDSRRMGAGSNGFSAAAERQAYSPREDFVPRDLRTQDHSFDGPLATSRPGRAQPPAFAQNTPFEKIWPEEQLRDMSLTAIKEFYSARDEGEVALCIKDLNSSSFHPSMISLWVTDSFERKDAERDVLAKLLVNLVRSQDATLTSPQLVKGFELVLTTLEDAVNDAPKAAEFLGRMFGKVVIENVVALRDIGQLLYIGGDEPGRLLEIGLAGDVLGSILEMIRTEKGESVLNEIRNSSNLCVEDFRPPDPYRSRILEKFIK